MSIPGTVQVTGYIAPTSASDSYPVIDPIYGIDGLRSVADHNVRDAIPASRRRVGMLVFTADDNKYWSLTSDLDTWVEFTWGESTGTPQGSNQELQYNNNGSFGGAAEVKFHARPTDVLTVGATSVTDIPLVVKGVADQTGNLQEWRNSDGIVLASINAFGSRSQSNGNFSAPNDSLVSTALLRNTTTDNTPTELFLDAVSARIIVAPDRMFYFTINVLGAATSDTLAIKLEGCIYNNGTDTIVIGNVLKTVVTQSSVSWDAAASEDAVRNALIVTVTGENSKTIRWLAKVELLDISL